MASSNETAWMERARGLIGHLSQPDDTGLTEWRTHRSMPPLDTTIDPTRGRHILRHFYDRVLPGQWALFMESYTQGASTDTLTMRLSSINIYAQLARVLTLEMMRPGYTEAVMLSTMMLDLNIETIAMPIQREDFSTDYEGGVVPVVDVSSVLDELPERDNPYFDTVLVCTLRHMTSLCVERGVGVSVN